MSKAATWIVGALAYVAAAALSFVLVSSLTTSRNGIFATFAILGLVPLLAAALLTGPLRRVDPEARFFANVVGLSGLWAVLLVAGVLVFARGALARALVAFPRRHPNAGEPFRSASVKLGRALTPAEPPAPSPPTTPPSASEAPGASSTPPTAADAGSHAAPVPASSAPEPSGEPRTFAAIASCEASDDVVDYVVGVQVADFDHDGVDEVIVQCRSSAEVWSIVDGAKIVETYRFAPEAPKDTVRSVGAPSAADVDGDGKLDFLGCVTWESPKGGTRGGQTWLALGRGDGAFGDLVVVDRIACDAVALHDVTGDGTPELLILQRGNPWQEDAPNGALAWLSGRARTWRARGRVAVGTYPDSLTFVDANGDGIDDVVVGHGWSTDREPRLVLGGRAGLRAPPEGTAVPPERDHRRATARFDRDATADRVESDLQTVKLLRTQPWRAPVVEHVERVR